MNFLAHFVLSDHDEALLTGNFLADFISNQEVKSLPTAIQEGIFLHRKIDSFMDNHPIVRQGSRRLYPYHHKYAPVVMDVLYDYLLAQNWHVFRQDTLEDFRQECYKKLQQNTMAMSPKLQAQLLHMISNDWLLTYTTELGVKRTFQRMQGRASKPEHLNYAWESLQRDYSLLNAEFLQFFPEIIAFVQVELER